MADKSINIPNDDTQNLPFCRLQSVDETSGHSTQWTNQSKFNRKSPKLFSQRIWNYYYKTFEIIVKTVQCPLPPCIKLYSHCSYKREITIFKNKWKTIILLKEY